MQRPWFRSANCSWYVEVAGKQVPLGRDERFATPPKVKPKEPPPKVQKRYLLAMQAQAEPEDRILSFCIDKYLDSMEGCRPNSIRRSKAFLRLFREAVGDIRISRLKSHHLTEFLKGKDWSQNTIRQVIITINACLNHCVRQDWIVRNPLRGKVSMPVARRREDVMSVEDADRVAAAAAPELKDVLQFLAGTGCRPIEAREALIEKCDLGKGLLMVPNKTAKKTGLEERPVFLSTAMIAHLRSVIGERVEGVIFRNSKGEKWQPDTLQKRMRRLCDELGIELGARLYSSRHRFISDAINKKKINPAMVAIQAGHTDLKQLMKTYLHYNSEAMREALDS